MDQYEVIPDGDAWAWRKRVDGEVVETSDLLPDRGAAIKAARAESGREHVKLVREDGSIAGHRTVGSGLRIVLLRRDGSLHGELDPPPSGGGEPQHVKLTPATEQSEVSLDG